MYELLIFFWLGGLFSLLFVVAEILHLWLHIHAEATRKIVHIGSGLLALLFPVYFTELWQVGALCAVFFFVLLISKKLGLLVSINGIKRKSLGSTLYPIIVFLTFAFYYFSKSQAHPYFDARYYFAAPILLMAICDPAAALAGTLYRRRHPNILPGKTMAGTLTFFLLGTLLAGCLTFYFKNSGVSPVVALLLSIVLGLATAVSERFSTKGWDNFTIPMSAAICIYFTTLLIGQ